MTPPTSVDETITCGGCGLQRADAADRLRSRNSLPALVAALAMGATGHEVTAIASLMGARPRCWHHSDAECKAWHEREAVEKAELDRIRGAP